jgi:hypothetical protein
LSRVLYIILYNILKMSKLLKKKHNKSSKHDNIDSVVLVTSHSLLRRLSLLLLTVNILQFCLLFCSGRIKPTAFCRSSYYCASGLFYFLSFYTYTLLKQVVTSSTAQFCSRSSLVSSLVIAVAVDHSQSLVIRNSRSG